MSLKYLSVWLMVCFPPPALAQVVFFDDFDGNALRPHWNTPPATQWEYNVSNGMLNITSLLYPSHPKSPTNFAGMGATFPSQTDFQLDLRMGWGATAGVARFDLTVYVGGGAIATIGYGESFGPTGVFAGTSAGVVTIPSPPPGIYDFRIARSGTQFRFFFAGDLFANLESGYAGPVDGIGLFFSGPYPGTAGPFHVDRVQVIPAPGVALVPAIAFFVGWSRRRPTRSTS